MFIPKSLLLTALVAVGVGLVAATEIKAEYIPGDTPPSSCTLKAGTSNFVTITLCPGGGVCPITVPCPAGPGGPCSRYDYQFDWHGVNPSLTVISVSADIGIRAVSPTGVITAPGVKVPGFDALGEHDFGQRWVTFTSNAATFNASITTDLSRSVAGTAGGQFEKNMDFCQLQTPGKAIVDPNAAVPISVVENLACGTIQRNLDSRGYTTSITPLPGGSCTTSTDTLRTERNQPALFIDPNTRITFQGSGRYCWPNGSGGMNCVP